MFWNSHLTKQQISDTLLEDAFPKWSAAVCVCVRRALMSSRNGHKKPAENDCTAATKGFPGIILKRLNIDSEQARRRSYTTSAEEQQMSRFYRRRQVLYIQTIGWFVKNCKAVPPFFSFTPPPSPRSGTPYPLLLCWQAALISSELLIDASYLREKRVCPQQVNARLPQPPSRQTWATLFHTLSLITLWHAGGIKGGIFHVQLETMRRDTQRKAGDQTAVLKGD